MEVFLFLCVFFETKDIYFHTHSTYAGAVFLASAHNHCYKFDVKRMHKLVLLLEMPIIRIYTAVSFIFLLVQDYSKSHYRPLQMWKFQTSNK